MVYVQQPNSSRMYSRGTTATLCDAVLQDFMRYSPDFELDVVPGNRSDMNTAEDMKRLAEAVCREY
jgi:hypothetical protein